MPIYVYRRPAVPDFNRFRPQVHDVLATLGGAGSASCALNADTVRMIVGERGPCD